MTSTKSAAPKPATPSRAGSRSGSGRPKGQAFQAQPINDQIVPVTLTDQANIATAWSTADATMVIEDVRKRYIHPAAEQLANTIDFDGLNRMTPTVWKSVGTPGVTPTSRLTYMQAGARLTKVAVPSDGRVAVLDPMAMVALVQDTLTLFNPSAAITENYRTGQFGRNALGVGEWYQDQNIYTHTTGSFASSTPLVFGANQTGNSLITNGWVTATLNKGDVFTVAGVYEVNPQNYTSTGFLQQFVVTAHGLGHGRVDDDSDQPGDHPRREPPDRVGLAGQRRGDHPARVSTITTGAGTMAATTSPNSLIFHPEAFVLAMADLDAELPGAEVTRVSDNELNISLRYTRQYHIGTDQKMARIDALYGFKEFRPDWAVRIWG